MPKKKPEDVFWSSRPYLAQIRHLANCKGHSPWPMLGWSIVRALHTVPYRVPYKSAMGEQALNSLVGISGPTGAGKTISQRLVERHLIFPDNNPKRAFSKTWTGLVPPGSGEAMPDYYVTPLPLKKAKKGEEDASPPVPHPDRLTPTHVWRHPNHATLFFYDEVGKLEGLTNRQGSTLIDYMKEGWSGSEFGRALAKGQGVILPADSYRFAFVINTQPRRAGVLFSQQAIAGGLQGRFLWFDVTADVNRGMVRSETVEPIYIPQIDWTGVENIPALVQMNEAHWQHHWNALDDLITESESHILLTRAKVAVALAVLDGRVELNEEDWQLSEVVIDHTLKTRESIEEALAEEYRSAVIRDGDRAAVKAGRSEAEKHKVNVDATAAAILRSREKTGRKKARDSDLSRRQRDYREEAEEFLRLNPDWRPPN